MWQRNKRGQSTVPFGTPEYKETALESHHQRQLAFLFIIRKSHSQALMFPSTPYCLILFSTFLMWDAGGGRWWEEAESKALEKS